jgi:hypothetical protein
VNRRASTGGTIFVMRARSTPSTAARCAPKSLMTMTRCARRSTINARRCINRERRVVVRSVP